MKQYRDLVLIILLLASCTAAIEKKAENVVNTAAVDTTANQLRKKVIVFFGNSITAAYGLERSEAFTTIIQSRLDSAGSNYEVINAGVSGETTASGKNRVSWVVERQPVDIFILELGANDGLRGLPVKQTMKNLEEIIDLVRKAHSDAEIILAGMMLPPSMGAEYTQTFQKIFPEIANRKKVTLIPFVLENVAGIDSLNQADGIHPNVKGEKIVAENVWNVLKNYIKN